MKYYQLVLITMMLAMAFFTSGCTQSNDAMIRVEDINCRSMGFIPVDEVNQLVSINNKLVTLVNACYEETGVEPLPYIKEYAIS